ncbi:thioesterase family protein [Ferviditalea candida]|uniref:Hotdog domain-containing protein n=1 Tax=Ferviditalea candida TaxID=3108399 RepID=A0ABU5ZMB7_9BACL|nr:hotdog domain-containing protein [Paenibacillaceae bacterium T2]
MLDGLKIGEQRSVSAVVTPEMYAQFEGQVVHEVFGTVWMVYHMEYAARQIILPYLKEDEEGMGIAVNVSHLAPAVAGSRITATAECTAIQGNRVVTDVEVRNEKGIIGKGQVTQIILPKQSIAERIERAAR